MCAINVFSEVSGNIGYLYCDDSTGSSLHEDFLSIFDAVFEQQKRRDARRNTTEKYRRRDYLTLERLSHCVELCRFVKQMLDVNPYSRCLARRVDCDYNYPTFVYISNLNSHDAGRLEYLKSHLCPNVDFEVVPRRFNSESMLDITKLGK